MIKAVHPLQRGELNGFNVPPRSASVDQFRLVETDDRLGERVVVGIANATYRRLDAIVAVDSSKFKAVNSRDRNFTPGKVDKRQEQIEQSIQRYLEALETADRTQPAEVEAKTERLQEKIKTLREQMRRMRRSERS